MSYIEESLSEGEEIRNIFSFHWFARLPLIFWIILVPFTLGISLIFVIYEWLRLKNLEYGVTNKRVIHKTGIIGRKSDEMKIGSIETVEINQGIFGRMFNFGTVRITGRGISDVVFKNIDDPMDVKRKIESVSH